ncbi:hypothetical protein GQ44DRAFT_776179 [Phaeosphaeriaceae sp. PMI808]|nr:hypothetical protein GQ44DRAFT_776179 [Phaeosphaeriaceae sp. PMI808]
MTEALAVIGTIGAVCNIVDVIGKTISIITDVRSRWKTADLALLSFASQLTSLRAALMEIQRWLDNNAENVHHQLTMDLDLSLSCCQLLASELEDFFSQFDTCPDNHLGPSDKIKLLVRGQGAKDIQRFIEHQTSSLTLLLTACNCTSLSEQKLLLEKPKTRKVLARAKCDSVSLIVHRDSASFSSRWTDNLSKLSYIFDFDTDVLSSRVYERVFRVSLKQSIRQQRAHSILTPQQHILVLGKELSLKILITQSIFKSHVAERNEEVTLLSQRSIKSKGECALLTVGVMEVLFPTTDLWPLSMACQSVAFDDKRALSMIVSLWFLPKFGNELTKVMKQFALKQSGK